MLSAEGTFLANKQVKTNNSKKIEKNSKEKGF